MNGRPVTPEEAARWVSQAREGLTVRAIASDAGRSISTVSRTLRRHGICSPHGRGRRPPRFTVEQLVARVEAAHLLGARPVPGPRLVEGLAARYGAALSTTHAAIARAVRAGALVSRRVGNANHLEVPDR